MRRRRLVRQLQAGASLGARGAAAQSILGRLVGYAFINVDAPYKNIYNILLNFITSNTYFHARSSKLGVFISFHYQDFHFHARSRINSNTRNRGLIPRLHVTVQTPRGEEPSVVAVYERSKIINKSTKGQVLVYAYRYTHRKMSTSPLNPHLEANRMSSPVGCASVKPRW